MRAMHVLLRSSSYMLYVRNPNPNRSNELAESWSALVDCGVYIYVIVALRSLSIDQSSRERERERDSDLSISIALILPLEAVAISSILAREMEKT